jgi:type IV secretory pathway TraG/TraD family ATPase VirD4
MRSTIRKNPKKAVKSKGPGITIGKGIDLQDPNPNIIPIKISDGDRRGHFFCFGTTGAGKTKLMENIIIQDIKKRYSVVCIDPKGDVNLVSKIVQTAYECGREQELSIVSPIYPHLSAKVDPLSYYAIPEELVNHVVSGIQASDEFYVNIAYETTLMIVKALLLLKKNNHDVHINFNAIFRECSFNNMTALLKQIEGFEGPEAEEVITGIAHIVGSTQEYFSKVASTLRTVLTSLSTGAVGQIIGKPTTNNFMKRLEEGRGVIMIVQTGSLLAGKTAHIVGRVIVSMIQTFAGRKLASGGSINPPLALHMDEFSNVAYLNIEDLFSKGRSANVMCHAYTQSVADLDDAIGKSKARKILDNTNTKLFMRVNDNETAKYIADYSGTIKKFSPILQTGGNITIREESEPAIMAEDVMRIRLQDFYLFTTTGGYKGRSSDVPDPYVNVKYPLLKTA